MSGLRKWRPGRTPSPGADLCARAGRPTRRKTRSSLLAPRVEGARKQAQDGADAVLLCDSLSRLAVAADGVDDVKKLFGSGRELDEEDAGSLTVIATTLGERDDEASAEKAVQTTETSLIALDASLAAEGISPALRFRRMPRRRRGQDPLRGRDGRPPPSCARTSQSWSRRGCRRQPPAPRVREFERERPEASGLGPSAGTRGGPRRARGRARSALRHARAGRSRTCGWSRRRRCRARLP